MIRQKSRAVRRAHGLLAAALLATSAMIAPPALALAQDVSSAPAAAQRPNVVVILVDDMAWTDLSTYGGVEVPTPNLDRIARSGAGFTNGYVPASVCAVSRAGLLTGRYPASMGFTYNINDRGDRDRDAGLPLTELTLAERLKPLGYATGAFGKWHQGAKEQFYPTNRGFDDFYGFISGETVYVDPKTPGIVTTRTPADKYEIDQREGNARIVEGPNAQPVDDFSTHLTTAITDRTVAFIDRESQAGRPFFAYVAYNAPHWPLQAPQEYYDRFSGIADPIRRTYVAMIAHVDAEVGRILDTLEARGERENTMVFFLSDNGCPIQFGFCEPVAPLGAGKFTYLEGGTRVPFLMSWPAGLAPHGLVDTPVMSIDVAPTVLDAVGATEQAKDSHGIDLIQNLAAPQADRPLFWGQDPVFAVRVGRYKLWKSLDWNEVRLFDLEADPAEKNDLSASLPQVRNDLEARIDAWRAGLPRPLWTRHAPTRKININGRETEWVY